MPCTEEQEGGRNTYDHDDITVGPAVALALTVVEVGVVKVGVVVVTVMGGELGALEGVHDAHDTPTLHLLVQREARIQPVRKGQGAHACGCVAYIATEGTGQCSGDRDRGAGLREDIHVELCNVDMECEPAGSREGGLACMAGCNAPVEMQGGHEEYDQ